MAGWEIGVGAEVCFDGSTGRERRGGRPMAEYQGYHWRNYPDGHQRSHELKERVSVLPIHMSLNILIGHEVQYSTFARSLLLERALCLICIA